MDTKKLQRYTPQTDHSFGAEMVPDDDGEYVLFADVVYANAYEPPPPPPPPETYAKLVGQFLKEGGKR